MVIYNICKVVGWEPIILHYYLIINHTIVKDDFAMNNVLEACLSFWSFHPNNERLSIGFFLFDLLFAERHTEPVVFSFGVFLATDLNPHFLQTLGGAEATVGVTILY